MQIIGVIAEYNPFHNGHLYHLNKIKEMFPNDVIILVLSGHFMQRGETSILTKWDKTEIAINYGVDLVVELPFPFATQSADFFAKGSIQILKELGATVLVFGSESNDIEKLTLLADTQLNSNEYQSRIKYYLDDGINYPTALSKALTDVTKTTVDTPNDILGISYIREIIKQKANIKPITIQRTNDYHSIETNETIASATSIRNAIKKGTELKHLVPSKTYEALQHQAFFIDDYFNYLKYQILINLNSIEQFQTVDEGLENRIKKNIITANNLEDLIMSVKTKRYTYNKLRRMFTHIMCNFTKEEAKAFTDITYLRILGFSKKGQSYLNSIKKETKLPIVSNFSKLNDKMLDLEFRATCVYSSILTEEEKIKLIEKEYKNIPIIK